MARSIGDQELDLLRFVAQHQSISARDAGELFGKPRGISPKTVLTMLERLRAKEYLTRQADPESGLFEYRTTLDSHEIEQTVAAEIRDRKFGGRIAPLVMALFPKTDITPEEADYILRIAQRVDEKQSKR